MKILFAGGHLAPALAVIDELSKKDEVIYVGRKHALEGDKALSLEYQAITDKGIKFEEIKTGRLQRSITRHTVPSLIRIPRGFYQSFKLIKKHNPEVVVGFGGYVSLPLIIVASLLKIPTVIHEQTLAAGAANLRLGKFATKVCVSFEDSREYFPDKKTVLTGNPIRKSIKTSKKDSKYKSKDPMIYITGGSLGSHYINQLVYGCLSQLLDKYVVVHQVGDAKEFRDFDKLNILKEGLNGDKKNRYILSKFYSVEDVGGIMKSASLVVSRAGVNTITELLRLKKPSFIIPLPISQKNEQQKNAEYIKKSGLGEVFHQDSLSSEEFLFQINTMMINIEKYKLENDIDNIHDKAAKNIVKVIYEVQKDSN